MSRLLAMLAVFSPACLAAVANAGEVLRYDFREGETSQYVAVQQALVTFNANGVEFENRSHQITNMTWTVKSVAADGTAALGQRVDRIQLTITSPFAGTESGQFAYDSETGTEGEGSIWPVLKPILTILPGQEFTLRVTPAGEVSDIVIPEPLVEAIASQPPTRMIYSGGNLFSSEAIRQTLELSIVALPTEAVQPGATWTRNFARNLARFGALNFELTASFEDLETVCGRQAARLGTKTTVDLQANEQGQSVELKLTEQEGAGTVHFDLAAGRLIRSSFEQKLVLDGTLGETDFIQEVVTTSTLTLAECVEGSEIEKPVNAEDAKAAGP
jgi:hypothetical protein